MASRERATKTIGGKTTDAAPAPGYTAANRTATKSEAQHLARWMRRGGFSARITGKRGGPYTVWTK